jgi:hypothetical protein
MTHFQSHSSRLLAVPGIGFTQSISIGQAMPDLPAFRDRSDDQSDAPTPGVDPTRWRRLVQPWLAARW